MSSLRLYKKSKLEELYSMAQLNPFKDNIHKDNYKDFELLVNLINELEKLDFKKRVQAKHYLSNILENVQPINHIEIEE
jgi:hypothetical protein